MSDSLAIRPEPAASGTLARTPLIHLLLYALDKGLAGTIEFAAPDGRSAAVLFAGGRPVKARTGEPVGYLGRSLLELGFLTEDQLTRSLTDLATAKRAGVAFHGQLLRSARLIDDKQLDAGLREQLLRKLLYAAAFPGETTYAYFDGFDSLRGWGCDEDRGFDPLNMIWSLLREHPPQGVIEPALARISASPLRLTRGADASRLGLGSEQRNTIELLRARPMRIDELEAAAGLGRTEIRLLAYLLLVTKQVDVLRASASSSIAPRPSESLSPPSVPSSAPTGVAGARASQLPAAHTSGPSIRPGASHSSVSPSSSRPSVRPGASASPPSSGSARPGASSSPPSKSPKAAISRPPTPSSAPAPPGLAPHLAERWREIVARAATIDRADYFSMLELARDATRDEVETAFLELAKVWHPDRLPKELGPVRDACSRVFARMSEARGTLSDDEKRAHYMGLLAEGSGSPEMQETVAKVVEAATNFQKAEVCFKRNDFLQAESFCRKAVEADATQPDYLALLAWLIALKPENQSPEKTRDSIQMLDRALGVNSRCEKAYFWRGMLYKRVGRADAAVRDFKRVVDMNPRNIDAAREVRLYRMRVGARRSDPPGGASRANSEIPRAPEDGKPGIFGRLFNKK
jgi:tetratricopeptide (TPR) repeat protein